MPNDHLFFYSGLEFIQSTQEGVRHREDWLCTRLAVAIISAIPVTGRPDAERNVSDQDKRFIDTERVRSVLQQAPLTLLVLVINAALTAIVLMPVASHTALSIWMSVMVVVVGARWIARQRILPLAANPEWARQFSAVTVAGSAATGILWGAGAAFLSPAAETHQLFFAFVVGGMCAGASSVNSAHAPTVLAFILPASLPLAARFLTEGSAPLVVSGLMTLVFAAALSANSLRIHRAFGERIGLQLALNRQGAALREANERLRDEVTERLRAEATLHQAQKMEAIGHLTGGVAHDFNNLLQVVVGNLGRISRLADGNPRVLDHVRSAELAVARGARLTSSLLAFARRQALQVERVSVNRLLEEFRQILLRAIDDSISLQFGLAPDLPDCLADPTHFQSAILNVVINARDAMPAGGCLSIITGDTMLEQADLQGNEDARPGRFVSVSVQDDGAGITPEVLSRVFEPFFTTKGIGKGSGLGLSQVYGFVRQSGGHVTLRSTPGAGTCVTILLPATAATPSA
jgi:signal transduction histidine kinase